MYKVLFCTFAKNNSKLFDDHESILYFWKVATLWSIFMQMGHEKRLKIATSLVFEIPVQNLKFCNRILKRIELQSKVWAKFNPSLPLLAATHNRREVESSFPRSISFIKIAKKKAALRRDIQHVHSPRRLIFHIECHRRRRRIARQRVLSHSHLGVARCKWQRAHAQYVAAALHKSSKERIFMARRGREEK